MKRKEYKKGGRREGEYAFKLFEPKSSELINPKTQNYLSNNKHIVLVEFS